MNRAWFVVCVLLCSCSAQPDDDDDREADLLFARDPASGMCMPLPPPEDSDDETPRWASWEACANPCAGLDEAACRTDPRCQPRYGEGYEGCAAVVKEDACLGLEERACSATDGCEPVYGADGVYRGCHGERRATCTHDEMCGAGFFCSTREGECRPPPGCDDGEVCPAVCGGVCLPEGIPPPTCVSDADCGRGMHCSVRDGDCGRPPGCEDDEVCIAVCAGVCVPDGVASCFAIVDERVCIAQGDCEAVYTGSECSCDDQGCSCGVYTFASCRPEPVASCDLALPGAWAEGIRRWEFSAGGAFALADAVAPCPPDAVCVWDGIVRNGGRYRLDPTGVVVLRYAEPLATFEGLHFPSQLHVKGCGREAALVEADTGRAYARTR